MRTIDEAPMTTKDLCEALEADAAHLGSFAFRETAARVRMAATRLRALAAAAERVAARVGHDNECDTYHEHRADCTCGMDALRKALGRTG
jgi:hypothetical protein